MKTVIVLVVIAAVGVLAYLGYRSWKKKKDEKTVADVQDKATQALDNLVLGGMASGTRTRAGSEAAFTIADNLKILANG